jgi:probable rRNA maturation factor
MTYKKKGSTEILRKTRGDIPALPFFKVKEEILGKTYELSLTFVDKKEMRKLSKEHKGSPNHMNTLAFPMDEKSGEIIMNLQTIRSQAKQYNKTYTEFLLFLFIHSSLHLKGHKHGDKMDKLEDKYFNKFNK